MSTSDSTNEVVTVRNETEGGARSCRTLEAIVRTLILFAMR